MIWMSWRSCPAQRLPESAAVLIFAVDKEVAFVDALRRQAGEAARHQRPADALPAIRRDHGEMVDVAATAVVPAQYCPHRRVVAHGDEAEAGIARQIGGNGRRLVGAAEADAFGRLP